MTWRDGIAFGAWYVWHPDFIHDRSATPDECWTVGHFGTGFAVLEMLEFADAVRVARALDDAIPDGDLEDHLDGLALSVIGAAIADHYVFPIDSWIDRALSQEDA